MKKKLIITFPENATPKEIDEYKKDWDFVLETFAKLTGSKKPKMNPISKKNEK